MARAEPERHKDHILSDGPPSGRVEHTPMASIQPSADASAAAKPKSLWARIKAHPLARIGPGLITGVADDDPSGIGTYSQAGAQFGLNMLWTMPLAYPLMSAIQSTCARIGRVTGRGLASNIKL